MVYIDLKSIEEEMKKSWICSVDRPAIISFRREDYHGDKNIELDKAVRKTILDRTGKKLEGPIRLLTHLRYFGYCFNPVSFYYCFDEKDSEVDLIMAEVTNTPWDERHSYIIHNRLSRNKKILLTAELDKLLHVSPFWGMDHKYEWVFGQPSNKLFVNMKNFKQGSKVFDATLYMTRYKFNVLGLLKQLCRFPFITLVVVLRIHWQAFKLWLKKAPFHIHPDKIHLMDDGN